MDWVRIQKEMEENKALHIGGVSNQREMLKAFCDWAYDKNEDWDISDYDIDKYLKSL
jgi:hypothetical protein